MYSHAQAQIERAEHVQCFQMFKLFSIPSLAKWLSSLLFVQILQHPGELWGFLWGFSSHDGHKVSQIYKWMWSNRTVVSKLCDLVVRLWGGEGNRTAWAVDWHAHVHMQLHSHDRSLWGTVRASGAVHAHRPISCAAWFWIGHGPLVNHGLGVGTPEVENWKMENKH